MTGSRRSVSRGFRVARPGPSNASGHHEGGRVLERVALNLNLTQRLHARRDV
jgi:hypothetical protein